MLPRRCVRALAPLLVLAPSVLARVPVAPSDTNPDTAPATQPDAAASHASPFDALRMAPDSVDAAAVFNNPARTLLLSDSGRALRAALATSGVFTHTEHAWSALAQALGADTDQTITDLLGRRVIVVWDGLVRQPGASAGLADALDTRWTLVCEVDQGYLGRIRERLKPVKRDIVQGRPLYAIEQGRYGIVLLDAPAPSRPARVLLAPKDGTRLLTRVLGAILPLGEDPASDRGSILDGRRSLTEQLAPPHPGDPWAVSWLIQAPPSTASARRRAVAGVISLDEAGLMLRFATDIPAPPDLGDAPASLLDAADADAPLALAVARLPDLLIAEHRLGLSMGVGETPSAPDPRAGPDLFNAPGLLVLTGDAADAGPHESSALTVFVRRPKDDPAPTAADFARRCDDVMRRLIGQYDPAQAPDYGGAFPGAVRTQHIEILPSDDGASDPAWPGQRPSLSWASGTLRDAGALCVSLGGARADTATRVSRFLDAARTLDALSEQPPPSGVLLRGRMRPAQVMELLGDSSSIDSAISRLVGTVSCDIERSPTGGVRGSLTLGLRRDPARPDLGADAD